MMASRDLELGFRDLAPEPFPEFDHPRERDDVRIGVRWDVQFMSFGVLVRVVIPTNRPIVKRAGRIRLRRPVMEPLGPSRRVRVTVRPLAKRPDAGPVGILSPLVHAIEVLVGKRGYPHVLVISPIG